MLRIIDSTCTPVSDFHGLSKKEKWELTFLVSSFSCLFTHREKPDVGLSLPRACAELCLRLFCKPVVCVSLESFL